MADVTHIPRVRVVYGPPASGKSEWARSLGVHEFFIPDISQHLTYLVASSLGGIVHGVIYTSTATTQAEVVEQIARALRGTQMPRLDVDLYKSEKAQSPPLQGGTWPLPRLEASGVRVERLPPPTAEQLRATAAHIARLRGHA